MQHAPGEFRPVALDLDGDGRIMTIANADTERASTGTARASTSRSVGLAMAKVCCTLDRNPNGAVDSGKELFSNSLVADAAKGVRSLAWVDANGDGVIDAADPVFGEFKVWQDTNGSATLDDGEARTLGELGITQLDYANNRYTRNGQLHALQSPTLETSAEGQRVSVIPEGIRVEFSNGKATLFVTSVTDLGAGNDGIDDGRRRRPGLRRARPADRAGAGAAGPGVHRAGAAAGQRPRRHQQLRAHDHRSRQCERGSVSINASDRRDRVSGAASTSTAPPRSTTRSRLPSGQSEAATVTVNVAPVNDRPDVRAVLPDRAIYGWGPLVQRRLVGGGEGGTSEEITITAHQGEPFYAPYHTVAGRRLVEKVSGGGEGGPISMWVETGPVLDTTIPKSYFDSEWAKVQAGQWSAENPAPTYLEFKWDGERYRVQGAPGAYLHDTPVASEPGNDGHVTVTDVDGGGGTGYRYEIYSQPLYGRLGGDGAADDIDPATGAFSYEGRRYVAHDEGGYDIMQNVYTDKHARAEWDGDPSKAANWDSFTVKVVDLERSERQHVHTEGRDGAALRPAAEPRRAKRRQETDRHRLERRRLPLHRRRRFERVLRRQRRRLASPHGVEQPARRLHRLRQGRRRQDQRLRRAVVRAVPSQTGRPTSKPGGAFDSNGDGVFSAAGREVGRVRRLARREQRRRQRCGRVQVDGRPGHPAASRWQATVSSR